MSSVYFEKCVCGLEFKIMRVLNDHKQAYTCECGHEIPITGTVLDIHYRKADQAGKLADWNQAPAWRIRDSR
jgi:hypothetical protein